MENNRTKDVLLPLSEVTSKLKMAILKNEDTTDWLLKYVKEAEYLFGQHTKTFNKINSMIKDIEAKGSIDPSVNDKIIPYSSVEDDIYGKFDFPSILIFTKNLLNRYFSNQYMTTYQIDQDKDEYLSSTYNMIPSISGIISKFNNQVEFNILSEDEIENFEDCINEIKNLYNDHLHARKILKEAVIAVIDAIKNCISQKSEDQSDIVDKMKFNVISNILDALNYMLVFRTLQIESINRYVEFFHGAINKEKEINESSIDSEIYHNDYNRLVTDSDKIPIFNVFANYNEMNIQNEDDLNQFFKDIVNMLKAAGIKFENENKFNNNYYRLLTSDNELYNKLVNNLRENNKLINFISEYNYSDNFSIRIKKEYDRLYKYTYSTKTFLSTDEGTEKNKLLEYIKLFGKTDDMDNQSHVHVEPISVIRKDVYELAIICADVLSKLSNLERAYSREYTSRSEDSNFDNNVTDIKLLTSCHEIVVSIFNDVAQAFLQKFRYFEDRLNIITIKDNNKIMTLFDLDTPKLIMDDSILNIYMTVAVPNTLKYEQSEEVFITTGMEILNEYSNIVRKNIHGDEIYFNEAAKDIIDKIIQFFKMILQKVTEFTTNYNKAANWVKTNANELTSYKFSPNDKISGVRDFKLPAPSEVFKGFNQLRTINVEQISKNIEEFRKSLYPSDAVYNIFKSNQKPDDAYRNILMYGSETVPQALTVSGNDLASKMKDWVSDISNFKTYSDQVSRAIADINQSLNSLNSKVIKEGYLFEADNTDPPSVSTNPQSTTSNNQSNNTTANQNNNDPTINPQQQKEEQEQNKKMELKAAEMEVLTAITRAANNITNAYQAAIKTVFVNEYNYIKQIYSGIIKPNSTSINNPNGTQQTNDKSRV